MTAGLNLRINIWRITQAPDDVVGGASITGTVSYYNVQARMNANEEQQLLLQQGLETMRTFNMTVSPGTLDIKERDEIQIVVPFNHPYIDDRFRVVGIRYQDLDPTDPRSYMLLSLTRSVRAHAIQ